MRNRVVPRQMQLRSLSINITDMLTMFPFGLALMSHLMDPFLPAVALKGMQLIIAGEDQFVRLWSVHTGERIHARVSETAFDDTVVGLQFSRTEEKGLWIAGKDLEYWSA
jgi:hypothetical protein